MTMSPLVISKAFPPCHTERSEVSHNTESTTESKRDFSPFSKAQNDKGERTQNDKGEGKRLKMTRGGGTAQNDTHRDFSFATQTQNDNVFYDD